MAYNLNFLTCYFDTPTYEVDEGGGVYVAFERDTNIDELLVRGGSATYTNRDGRRLRPADAVGQSQHDRPASFL